MTDLRFVALPTGIVNAYKNGGLDANGQRPEQVVSQADGLPCRYCLDMINQGEA